MEKLHDVSSHENLSGEGNALVMKNGRSEGGERGRGRGRRRWGQAEFVRGRTETQRTGWINESKKSGTEYV